MEKKLLITINLDIPLFIREGVYEFLAAIKQDFEVDKIITTYENGGLLSFYKVSELPLESHEEVEVEPTGGVHNPFDGILFCDSLNNKSLDVVIEAFKEIEEEENIEMEFENNEGKDERDCIRFYEDK